MFREETVKEVKEAFPWELLAKKELPSDDPSVEFFLVIINLQAAVREVSEFLIDSVAMLESVAMVLSPGMRLLFNLRDDFEDLSTSVWTETYFFVCW